MPRRTAFAGPTISGLAPPGPGQVWDNVRTIHSLGPIDIDFDFDPSVPQVSVKVKVFGTTLGSVVLNPSNPTASIGGDIGIASAKVELSADFTKKCVTWSAEACAPFIGCAGYEDDWCW